MNANEDTITVTGKFGHDGNCITFRLLAGRFALGAVLMAALTGCASLQATPGEYGNFDSVLPAALEAVIGAVNGLGIRNGGAGVAPLAGAYGIEPPMPGVRPSAPRMGGRPPLRHRRGGRFR